MLHAPGGAGSGEVRDEGIERQASEIVDLLPRTMRGLFALDVDDPATELPVGQLRVCGVLKDGPHNMSALSRELGISLSATTQIADRLERAGFVERVCADGDRRVKRLILTPHGTRVMRERRERRIACVREALSRLTPEAREDVLAALRLLRAACSDPPCPDEPASEAETAVVNLV